MPTQLNRPSAQLVALIVGLALLVGSAFGLARSGSGVDELDETGRLDVAGVVYRFAPTTCTITDTDFLAAGPGRIDGEPFWISASADRVDLAVGPESDADIPDRNQVWLISVQEVRWKAADDHVDATAVLRDERDTGSPRVLGALSVDCPSA